MNIETETNNNFQTDDLLISSYLLCRQAKLIDIVSDSPRHFIFIFLDLAHCKNLVHEYLNNGTATARELFARREELITQMRNRDRNGNSYGART